MADREDEIGRRRPRWSEPSGKSGQKAPIAIALDAKTQPGSPDRSRKPKVVATGRGPVAEQILAIAFERGVPVREDADLAQILATVELDSEIPIDALAAVAEILSYVYRANRTWSPDSTEPAGSKDD